MMRRLFIICLLLTAVPCFAIGPESMMMKAPAATGSCNCSSGCTFIGENVTTGTDNTGDGGYAWGNAPTQAMWQTGSGDAGKQVCEISVYAHYGSTATYVIRTAMYDNTASPNTAKIVDTQNTTVSNASFAWIGAMNSSQINGGTPVYVAASTYYSGWVWIQNDDTHIKYTLTGAGTVRNQGSVNYVSGFPATLTTFSNAYQYSIRIGYK
jgi:hypothetical protein